MLTVLSVPCATFDNRGWGARSDIILAVARPFLFWVAQKPYLDLLTKTLDVATAPGKAVRIFFV